MGKSLYEKRQETFKLAEHYGINVDDYTDDNDNRISIGGAEMNQLKKDVARAAANDYDLRETLTAAANSGKKKAQDILDEKWSYKDLSAISNAHNFQEKAAKRHGQGGNFSTTSDAMGLTQSMQDREKRVFLESLNLGDKKGDGDGKSSEPFQLYKDRTNIQLSPEIAHAKARVAQRREDVYSGTTAANLYDFSFDPTGEDSFLNRYIKNMSKPLFNGNYSERELDERLAERLKSYG